MLVCMSPMYFFLIRGDGGMRWGDSLAQACHTFIAVQWERMAVISAVTKLQQCLSDATVPCKHKQCSSRDLSV